jgi:glycosyltransferase involved in cell wall biosynthesis
MDQKGALMKSKRTHPLVSIITPSRNQAPFLEATIQSVLGQDYPEIEYLVIDGDSIDGSLDIIKRYQKRLAYWVSEPDLGQTDAINKGFAHAKGEIFAWLNSDDLLLPGAISKAVEYLISCNRTVPGAPNRLPTITAGICSYSPAIRLFQGFFVEAGWPIGSKFLFCDGLRPLGEDRPAGVYRLCS